MGRPIKPDAKRIKCTVRMEDVLYGTAQLEAERVVLQKLSEDKSSSSITARYAVVLQKLSEDKSSSSITARYAATPKI